MIETWKEILLKDNKNYVERIINPNYEELSSLDKIMKYFACEFKYNEPKDLENRDMAHLVYSQLGWSRDNKYFDIINSFYTIFVCALVAYAKSEEAPKFSRIHDEIKDEKLKKIISKWDCKLFDFGEKTLLKCAMTGKLGDIGKEAYAGKVTSEGNLQEIIINKYFLTDSREISEKIVEFAALSHCVANFMPCPTAYENAKKSYNQLKGILKDVQDFLPLMVDKIQRSIDEGSGLKYSCKKSNQEINQEISIDTLIIWQKWFIENRKKYFLEEYYYIKKDDKSEDKLVGIPLFKKQSLSYPIPKTKDEVKECISNIISITQNRALKMADKLKDKNPLK